MTQLELSLMHSDVHKTTSIGIEMGVLENGVPYLSQRGIAKMSGVPETTFRTFMKGWSEIAKANSSHPLKKVLEKNGYDDDDLYLEIEVKGRKTYAYIEPVCISILEYYAFEANPIEKEAVKSFRTLATAGFRKFVYGYTGYTPESKKVDSWKHLHDRLDMTMESVPDGYFSVFTEITKMIVPMIRAGVIITDKFIPDISVGQIWSKYWQENKIGERKKYEHNYPEYYRQSTSNPQQVWAYSDDNLAMFRKWFKSEYITNKFPKYMLNKVKSGGVDVVSAELAINAVSRPLIK